jgi:hypothetical protein
VSSSSSATSSRLDRYRAISIMNHIFRAINICWRKVLNSHSPRLALLDNVAAPENSQLSNNFCSGARRKIFIVVVSLIKVVENKFPLLVGRSFSCSNNQKSYGKQWVGGRGEEGKFFLRQNILSTQIVFRKDSPAAAGKTSGAHHCALGINKSAKAEVVKVCC